MNEQNKTDIRQIGGRIFELLNRFKYLFFVLLTTGLYSGIVSMRTMPFAEGWYSYYAQCINNGEVVYRDFDYLFTPLYIYFIALITKIFGYKIIVLRILGVIFFMIIAAVVYLIMREFFDKGTSTIAAITSCFYLQSEVVQVFYDYVRFMDIFSCLTALFLIRAVKNLDDEKKSNRYFLIAGITNALFALVKQNMGILFFVYAILLLLAVNLVRHNKFGRILKNESYFLIGFLVPILITVIAMIINGSLLPFFHQTGSEAIKAKGGISVILFGWIKDNMSNFPKGKKLTLFTWLVTGGAYILRLKKPDYQKTKFKKLNNIVGVLFGGASVTTIIVFVYNSDEAVKFIQYDYLLTYNVFTIVFAIFAVMVIDAIIKAIRHKEISTRELMLITLAGSYFAISYGCGMSSGLAAGQATLGVALMIGLIIDSLDIKYTEIIKLGVIFICLLVVGQSAAKKMFFTYSWWDIAEANFWESTQESTDIENLSGIHMQQRRLHAYETIYNLVMEHSEPDEPIYCFPHISVMYTLCDRTDPGVRAKVQWFDVASDASIQSDMEVIENNPPAVIVIYNTIESTYITHERLFRNGERCSTRAMRDFLYDFAEENGYTYYGKIFVSQDSSFYVYYRD